MHPSTVIFWCTTALKLLLIPLYHSTDFDVHRNWLAITASLPLSQWYTEATSEWTLDYPPFFAWAEWALTWGARLFDPQMLTISATPYFSPATLYYQRLSVIATDVLLFYAIRKFTSQPWLLDTEPDTDEKEGTTQGQITTLLLTFINPGLLIVDHIHFQYNGFLMGIFILSIAHIKQGNDLIGGILFAILLNFKHIFLYVAPVYFVYLLFHYCYQEEDIEPFEGWEEHDKSKAKVRYHFSFFNFFKLGGCVIIVFALSLGPFIMMGQFPQLRDRLFPFKRGLVHAYWAPNVWAIYNLIDKCTCQVLHHLFSRSCSGPSSTSGLVADIPSLVLPTIQPLYTMILTIVAMMPILIALWRTPHPRVFLSSMIYCSLSSFMLGWHVHEKAILMVTLPLTLTCIDSVRDSKICLWMNIIGIYSLLPLLYQIRESPVKYLLFACYTLLSYQLLYDYHIRNVKQRRIQFHGFFNRFEIAFLTCLIPVIIFNTIIHPIFFARFSFAPLLVTSVYCAVGTIYGWWLCYCQTLRQCQLVQSYG